MLGEGFQLDSSLSYHSGDNEGIEGDLDVVIPLWDGGRHAVFAQPGAVFWTGWEEEERIDGNIGLVYRAELTRDLVAGASVFYDHDFQIGHSRVSGGIDLQSQFFRLGANYYHVLSEVEDGREGFVEEAVDGMDARLIFERDVVRLGSTVGYWDYEGEESSGGEDSQSGWKTSIGLDAGVRILPGVFAEASWERHKDDLVLDERIFAGLAFRFSLPDFEGASYGDGSMSANLYKAVDREKRILYEEREADGILLSHDGSNGNIVGSGTVNVSVRLRKPSAEDVVINLVGSGSATYGTDADWTLSVGSTPCIGVTGDDCQITIIAGETSTSDNVEITINDDGRLNEHAETIILRTTVTSGDTSLTSRPLALTIPEDLPVPTVSLSATSTSITEGDTATITLTLSEALESDTTFNLISGGTGVVYGTSAGDDWNLSVDGNDCDMATGTMCQVTIDANDTDAEVTVETNADTTFEAREDFTVSIEIASVGSSGLIFEGSSILNFDIPDHRPTVSLSDITSVSGGTPVVQENNSVQFMISLSETVSTSITVNLIVSGSATYSSDWELTDVSGSDCVTSNTTTCPVTIAANDMDETRYIFFNSDTDTEGPETVIITAEVDSASENFVRVGSQSRLELTIPAN